MSEIEIRTMREQDLERVMEILGHWGMAPVEPSPECPDPEHSGLQVGTTLVALSHGRVIGVAGYRLVSHAFAWTESLGVDPAWIGMGVADRLQLARLAALRTLGVERVRTTADRPRTIAWYVKRFGCRIVGAQPKKHPISLPDVPDWTVLELDLKHGTEPGRRRSG